RTPDTKRGIVPPASAAGAEAKNRRASHLTAAGRKALFEVPYVLAWGTDDQPVKADALVTGLVTLSPDLRTTTVHVQAFGREQPDPAEVLHFVVPTDARTLTEAGRSYRLRQLFPEKADEPAKSALQVQAGEAAHPLKNTDVPWEIVYDKEKVALEYKDGTARVKGPKEGQDVSFVLENRGKERYGVVLKVNGE